MNPTILLYLVFNLLIISSINSQTCSDCTISLSTSQNSPIYINPGEKLCITSTGELNATLYIWGGEVCNEGIIHGAIDMTDGVFNNYGHVLSGLNISVDKGSFNNQSLIQAGQISFNGSAITVVNNGTVSGNNFQMIQQGDEAVSSFTNHGFLELSSYMADSTMFSNYGSLTTSGQFMNNNNASFFNYGVVSVGANFTNRAYFYTDCIIPVGGLWANNTPGIIEGPMNGCGGFETDFSTSNFSDFGMDGSNLDMCASNSPGSFTFNTGNIGPNVTYCSCTNFCLMTVSSKNHDAKNEIVVYPNPASNIIHISSKNLIQRIFLKDIYGKTIISELVSSNSSSIDISGIPAGIYYLQADKKYSKIVISN